MTLQELKLRVRPLWQYLREVTGDDAYERYVAHHKVAHAGQQCLTQRQFFVRRQEDKWSKVSRCC
jgi:uncharacterized short protein YbdD (DUF466 family)